MIFGGPFWSNLMNEAKFSVHDLLTQRIYIVIKVPVVEAAVIDNG